MTGFLTPPAAYPYRTGSLFLGLDPATNAPVGISTERHAITIAGARSGKGAALLIPNALRWSDNLLVIDPKGEIANAAWQAREALGQQVAVLDPFGAAKAVPDRLRATFNPLAEIDLTSPVAGDEIRVIADGLVKRHKAEDGDWYDGAVRILAGVLAFVMESAPPEHRTFAAMRSVLLQPNEVKDDAGNLVGGLYHDAQMMQGSAAFGGLAKGAGVSIMTALTSDKGQEKTHLSMAREATVWMDQALIASTLAASSFDLRDLKAGKLSVFLVLPPKYMGDYSAFLRLFVRGAINAMMDDDEDNPRRCLFLLDEFYSLGKLDVVEQAAGLMGGYGLHLWPFMQDLGQLRQLYGDRMAETFFSNADAAVFFGNSDRATLQYVSGWAGNLTPSEVVAAPPPQNYTAVRDPEKTGFFGGGYYGQKFFEGEKEYRSRLATEDENNRRMQATIDANSRAAYEHSMRQSGKPRLTPEQVAALVGKKDGDKVARSALVFTKGGDLLNVRLQPYFTDPTVKRTDPARHPQAAGHGGLIPTILAEATASYTRLALIALPVLTIFIYSTRSINAASLALVAIIIILGGLVIKWLRSPITKTKKFFISFGASGLLLLLAIIGSATGNDQVYGMASGLLFVGVSAALFYFLWTVIRG